MTDQQTMAEQKPAAGSTYRDIGAFLMETQILVENARSNPAIKSKLVAAGYPEAEMEARLADLLRLRSLHEQQLREYGEQMQATQAWQDAQRACNPAYIRHVELARIAFRKDPLAQRALGLEGRRADSQSGYISQGLLFYNNALGDSRITAGLAAKGIDQAALQEGSAAFGRLQALKGAQLREMGEAQQATKDRDDAWDALAEWEMDFRATAKAVLRESGQLIEELGIVRRR